MTNPAEPLQTRRLILPVAAMTLVIVASNILVQYPFAPFGLADYLTWGAFTYPFAFLVTDLTNRRFGPGMARKVVYVGFAAAVVLSIMLATPRIALASGTAFLAAQLIDVAVFHRLRRGSWWRAPLVSSTLGSTVDTALFFSLAFAPAFALLGPNEPWALEAVPLLGTGPQAALWISLAVGDFGVKLAIALAALVPFRLAILMIRGQAA